MDWSDIEYLLSGCLVFITALILMAAVTGFAVLFTALLVGG